jgi:hypothetical protein
VATNGYEPTRKRREKIYHRSATLLYLSSTQETPHVAISLIDKESTEESVKLYSNILSENILVGQGPGFSNPDNEEIFQST